MNIYKMYYKIAQHTNIYKYLHISHLQSIYKRLLQSANPNQPPKTIATLERERERESNSLYIQFNPLYRGKKIFAFKDSPFRESQILFRLGIPFSFLGKYIQFEDSYKQQVKNIFNILIGTINEWIYFLIRGLIQSSHGKYFQCIGWHIQRGEIFFNALTGTFNAWKFFLMRRLIQSIRGKYFQCINWHNQRMEVFFNELIVTFNE
jgi:hypothetical protein